MVESTIRQVDKDAPVKSVNAGARGKVVRAEPISAIYEQGKASHVGEFPDLEDEMCSFTPSGFTGDHSPDRTDAMVWAMTELMQGSTYSFSGWLDGD